MNTINTILNRQSNDIRGNISIPKYVVSPWKNISVLSDIELEKIGTKLL
jgi:hypothetical protein